MSRNDQEYKSVETFAAFLRDDERETFTVSDLEALNFRTHIHLVQLRKSLETMGFSLAKRELVKRVRGFTTSSNDRWYGPGADKTHGGTGF